jgi:hypothetical protein
MIAGVRIALHNFHNDKYKSAFFLLAYFTKWQQDYSAHNGW